MFSARLLSLTALIVAIAAAGMGYRNGSSGGLAQRETAYEHVMRTRTLRCGYINWPLIEEKDPNTGQMKGLVPDIIEQLGEKLGLKIEWTQEIAFGQQADALATGKIDALCLPDGPFVYAEAAMVDYTTTIGYFPAYLFGREGETRFKDMASVNAPNVTLSTIDGDISMTLALEKFPQARRLEVPEAGDASLVATNVLDGKADLLIEDALTVDGINRMHDHKLVRVQEKPFAIFSMVFSVAKRQQDLLQMLNQGLELLQELGMMDQILDRYDPKHQFFYRPAKPWQQEAGRR